MVVERQPLVSGPGG